MISLTKWPIAKKKIMEINSTPYLSISCRMLLMSFPNLNFFPNGMSEIITSTLCDGSGNSAMQKPETPVMARPGVDHLKTLTYKDI